MHFKVPWICLVMAVIVAPVAGVAQVYEFGAQKGALYEQTKNDTEPSKPDQYSLYAFFNVEIGEADEVTVSTVNTYKLKHSEGLFFNKTVFFKDLTALDKKFPVGDAYTFKVKGGKLNGESGALPIQADAFPAVPYLTGKNELTELKEISSGSDVTVNFALGASGATSTGLYFAIYDKSVAFLNYAIQVGTTSFTIPASYLGNLKTGHLYQGQITNYNTGRVTSTGSFTAAPNSDGWVTTTTFGIRVK